MRARADAAPLSPTRPRRFSANALLRLLLAVVLAAELRRLGPPLVPGLLQDRRNVGVGSEV